MVSKLLNVLNEFLLIIDEDEYFAWLVRFSINARSLASHVVGLNSDVISSPAGLQNIGGSIQVPA